MLLCGDVLADNILMIKWYAPTERENNAPLSVDEIDRFKMYTVSCNDPATAEPPMFDNLYHKQGIVYISSKNPVECVVMKTVDVDGRESLPSHLMRAVPYNAPRPPECRQ